MMIRNKTKSSIIAKEYNRCESVWSKAIGLMFRRKIAPMVFIFDTERRVSLHMFFVFNAIDVLFLDDKKKVVEILNEGKKKAQDIAAKTMEEVREAVFK